ncbi:MAG: XrtA system polysaccharide deacetylase [Sulfitobacter sp.]
MKTGPFELAKAPLARAPGGGILNAMTVDVEDYYHAHALESHFTRDTWPALERRVEDKTKELLDLFDAQDTKATFFTLGTVAREFPALIQDIVRRGHELASHGLEHYRASEQDPAAFKADVVAAKDALQDASGVAVNGYRAASFSIDRRNWWAFDVLEDAGYTYSSSVSAGKFTGSEQQTPFDPFLPGKGCLVECPISTVPMLTRAVPTGGGYFRLAPYAMFRHALRRAQLATPRPANFYFHPWEIDPEQPKARVPIATNFRHRVHLARMKGKIAQLLSDFQWGRMQDVFGPAFAHNLPTEKKVSS